MNNNTTTQSASDQNLEQSKPRQRFCDSFGFHGLMCLAFFAAFVAMIEYGGKF